MKPTPEQIEETARAICVTNGESPDASEQFLKMMRGEAYWIYEDEEPHWRSYLSIAEHLWQCALAGK